MVNFVLTCYFYFTCTIFPIVDYITYVISKTMFNVLIKESNNRNRLPNY